MLGQDNWYPDRYLKLGAIEWEAEVLASRVRMFRVELRVPSSGDNLHHHREKNGDSTHWMCLSVIYIRTFSLVRRTGSIMIYGSSHITPLLKEIRRSLMAVVQYLGEREKGPLRNWRFGAAVPSPRAQLIQGNLFFLVVIELCSY
jgi:hypothetical protein